MIARLTVAPSRDATLTAKPPGSATVAGRVGFVVRQRDALIRALWRLSTKSRSFTDGCCMVAAQCFTLGMESRSIRSDRQGLYRSRRRNISSRANDPETLCLRLSSA